MSSELTNYTVQSGDNLWNIAKKVYGDGSQYTKILDANRDKISNPDLIYKGQVLTIPGASDSSPTPEVGITGKIENNAKPTSSSSNTQTKQNMNKVYPSTNSNNKPTPTIGREPTNSSLQQKINQVFGIGENSVKNMAGKYLDDNGNSSVFNNTTYTVQSGDSLRKIAQQFYGDGSQYTKILDANLGTIIDPNVIHAGQVLKIPKVKVPTSNVGKSYTTGKETSSNSNTNTNTNNNTNTTLNPALKNTNVKQDKKSTGFFTNSVGKRIANTATYNNSAATGQCVWYVRVRATEKLGKDTGAIGNANQMWYNAKSEAKLPAKADNIKPNSIISYKYGSGSLGQTYGHVIFVEDVVGDTVYYTEGGSGYYKNGTDGVVKTGTKSQILQGVNSAGARIGSNAIGIIDLSKY